MGSLRRSLMIVDRLLKSTATINRSSVSAAASSPNLMETLLRPQYGHVNGGVCRCFSNNYNSNTQSHAIDLSNEESKRRLFNRLLYRSRQRGFLELDLVLGKWVEEHIHSLDENGIKALCDVLDLENPDLWKWLTGQEQPPEPIKTNPVFNAVCYKVMNNLNNHAAPETRATAGQPWVRGWDDFKKGRDSPITGNQ